MEEEIKKNNLNIETIERIKFKDEEGKLKDSSRVKIIFRATTRPKEIKAYYIPNNI